MLTAVQSMLDCYKTKHPTSGAFTLATLKKECIANII